MDFNMFLWSLAQALSNEYTNSGELFIAAKESDLYSINMFCHVTKKGECSKKNSMSSLQRSLFTVAGAGLQSRIHFNVLESQSEWQNQVSLKRRLKKLVVLFHFFVLCDWFVWIDSECLLGDNTDNWSHQSCLDDYSQCREMGQSFSKSFLFREWSQLIHIIFERENDFRLPQISWSWSSEIHLSSASLSKICSYHNVCLFCDSCVSLSKVFAEYCQKEAFSYFTLQNYSNYNFYFCCNSSL